MLNWPLKTRNFVDRFCACIPVSVWLGPLSWPECYTITHELIKRGHLLLFTPPHRTQVVTIHRVQGENVKFWDSESTSLCFPGGQDLKKLRLASEHKVDTSIVYVYVVPNIHSTLMYFDEICMYRKLKHYYLLIVKKDHRRLEIVYF